MNTFIILGALAYAIAFALAARTSARASRERFRATMDRHDRQWAELQRLRAEAHAHLR